MYVSPLIRVAAGVSGHLVNEISLRLQAAWKTASQGGDLSDELLFALVQAVYEGRGIKLDVTQFCI